MFDILFGWRKASKCKKLIKRVQCRLKLLKNKRHSMVRQLRQDMAQLIKLGYEESAFNRAEQLFKDECAVAVYEMLDNFCQFVILNLSYIRKHKDVPNDVNEAVSSLIFASARCGDLPELPRIRELFRERYGLRFATAAVHLLPGNLVNREMKENLSTDAVSDEVKYRLVDEIAKDYCLQPEVLALEYPYESKHQLREQENQVPNKIIPTSNTDEGTNIQASDSNSESISTTVSSSIVEQSSPEKVNWPVHNNKEQVYSPTTIGDSEGKQGHKPLSSSESSPYDFDFPEEMAVYLDDIEEFRSSPKDGDTDVKVEESYSPRYFTSSSSSSRSENPLPPYSRAMTMPQQRPNVNNLRETFLRSVSCPFQHSTHVHPKLPSYDEIAARFSALKKQCLQNKQPCNGQ